MLTWDKGSGRETRAKCFFQGLLNGPEVAGRPVRETRFFEIPSTTEIHVCLLAAPEGLRGDRDEIGVIQQPTTRNRAVPRSLGRTTNRSDLHVRRLSQAAPFPAQKQPTPGSTDAMQPRPDHGESSYRGSGKLKGMKAVITGGDSGIGRAVAIAFAREGADVLIAFLNETEEATEVKKLIEKEGRKAVLVPGDLQDAKHCREVIKKAVDGLGGIDILVNNAAHQATFKDIGDISDEEWEKTFRTNIHAMFYLTKAAVPHSSWWKAGTNLPKRWFQMRLRAMIPAFRCDLTNLARQRLSRVILRAVLLRCTHSMIGRLPTWRSSWKISAAACRTAGVTMTAASSSRRS